MGADGNGRAGHELGSEPESRSQAMSEEKKLKERIDNTAGGGHVGGTKFGQVPGEGAHKDDKRGPDTKPKPERRD
jgi:hypothetical protein